VRLPTTACKQNNNKNNNKNNNNNNNNSKNIKGKKLQEDFRQLSHRESANHTFGFHAQYVHSAHP
jgi:hypothetical protein